MKTITLSESAYQRLEAWKQSPKDSFSKVVERVVPARGTLDSVMLAWESLPPISEQDLETMEQGLRALNDWACQKDPAISMNLPASPVCESSITRM